MDELTVALTQFESESEREQLEHKRLALTRQLPLVPMWAKTRRLARLITGLSAYWSFDSTQSITQNGLRLKRLEKSVAASLASLLTVSGILLDWSSQRVEGLE